MNTLKTMTLRTAMLKTAIRKAQTISCFDTRQLDLRGKTLDSCPESENCALNVR